MIINRFAAAHDRLGLPPGELWGVAQTDRRERYKAFLEDEKNRRMKLSIKRVTRDHSELLKRLAQ